MAITYWFILNFVLKVASMTPEDGATTHVITYHRAPDGGAPWAAGSWGRRQGSRSNWTTPSVRDARTADGVQWRGPTSCVSRGAWCRHFKGAKTERSGVTAGSCVAWDGESVLLLLSPSQLLSLLQLMSYLEEQELVEFDRRKNKEKRLKFDAGSEEMLLI